MRGLKLLALNRSFPLRLLLALPLVVIFVGCEDTINLAPQGVEGIQVTGSGSVSGKPDVALLSLGISTERASVTEAREEAAAAMQRVIDSLKANGVAEKDIQTQQFSIYPQYDYTNNKQALRGYRVTNMVSIKVRALDKVGVVIDDVAAAGGDLTQVQSISFTIDEPKELQAQARVEAMKDAKAKAQTLADEGGVKLGKPVSISESIGFSTPSPFLKGGAEAASVTPIAPGELEVTVTVAVIYAIE
jgi:uncharacterized protein YggE